MGSVGRPMGMALCGTCEQGRWAGLWAWPCVETVGGACGWGLGWDLEGYFGLQVYLSPGSLRWTQTYAGCFSQVGL